MNNSIITKQGMELLSSVSAGGEAKYWIGYFGLAYVPDRSAEGDPLKADMQQLTSKGDYIYNVWQGGMTDTGFAEGDTSAAANLYGMSLYSGDIMQRYRYILDERGNNNLVMWRANSDGTGLVGGAVYQGVGANAVDDSGKSEKNDDVSGEDVILEKSEMPLPAPLFYMGEPVEYTSPVKLNRISGRINAATTYSSGAKEHYPTHDVDADGDEKTIGDSVSIPSVSTDGRAYNASNAAMTKASEINGRAIFETCDKFKSGNKYEWASAASTYTQNDDALDNSPITEEYNKYCKQYWKLQSISNYNRFHAPASVEGLAVNYEPACRNMSKATKYFPINHYTVKSAKETNMWYDEATWTEQASTLDFTLEVSLQRMQDYAKSIVDRTVVSGTATSGIYDIDGTDLFASTGTSFKFNRVGIYAVPMTVNRFSSEDGSARCDETRVQFELNGNAEPILFAVIDYSDDIVLRDTGSANRWKINFSLNMENSADNNSVISDAGIFYSMYEDDSLNWYRNQLIATASTSEAVTQLGLQMNYLKQMVVDSTSNSGGSSGGGTCGGTATKYAPLNHTHQYAKNIVDADSSSIASVRGINTAEENSSQETYTTGAFNPNDSYRKRLSEYAVPVTSDIDGSVGNSLSKRLIFKRYRGLDEYGFIMDGIDWPHANADETWNPRGYLDEVCNNFDDDN